MYKSLLLLCLVGVICAQEGGDLDSILNDIFGPQPPPTQTPLITVQKPTTIVPPVTQPQDWKIEPCKTADGKEGRCVPYYLCNSNNEFNSDGDGIISIRQQSNKCNSYLDICCNIPEVRNNPKPPRPPKKNREGCGWRNPDGIGVTITGDKDNESQFGEFPWMVAILNTDYEYVEPRNQPLNDANPEGQQLNSYVGGGSLIHPAVVLTTAHYVVSIKTLKVRAGEWDTQTTREIYPYQERDVDSIVVHKDFNKKVLFYDIALLFLSSPMDISIPNVGLACLPPPRQRTAGGVPCFASGWGKDKFGKDGRYQVILKKVTVPVVERKQCQTQLRRTRLGPYFELNSSFMCAGGEAGIDTCKGDGGSPLMCPIEGEPDRYMQSGMVAWGIGCGEDGTPGVYVDVSNLRDWIDAQMEIKRLNQTIYTF